LLDKSSREARRFAPGGLLLAAAPGVVAMASILGLRGFGGHYLSPGVSFGMGVVALAAATQLHRSLVRNHFPALCEIGLALAIVASVASALAAAITGQA
jgi:hypothetical protein